MCLQPAVLAFESSFELGQNGLDPKTSFELGADFRRWVLWRADGGFGTDEKLRWLFERNYQAVVKGFSGRRADNLAKQVKRWNPHGDAWLGAVYPPLNFGREVFVWVKRRLEKGEFKHSYYITTVKLHSLQAAMDLYDQRGSAEIEQFRNDKQGLHLSDRRKHGVLAQKALILLTDIAHNVLTDFHHRALAGSPFEEYAAKRIVRDLLKMEGNLIWQDGQLARVELCRSIPLAEAFLGCLAEYCGGKKSDS